MKFSIFTAFHNHRIEYLLTLYESLKEQTYSDWEWVLIPNGDGLTADITCFRVDDRVKAYPFEYAFGKVGACKRFACYKATGDYLVEVDYDDLLTPDCLEKLKREIDKDAPDFIFSNFCQVDMNMNPANPWSPYYGWTYRDYNYKGKVLQETINPPFIPQNNSRIWFNVNHVRVWKTSFYKQLGGHDLSMEISDDHDLILRSYLEGTCRHIDDCLYIYRLHGDNTTFLLNQQIQDTMWQTYDKYIWRIAEKWADDNKLRKIDLAGGVNPKSGYETYDIQNADIIGNLDDDWKLEDNSVGILRAHDAVEHFKDIIHTMNEAWRVLAHGGMFMILVPSTDGQGAFSDPTHCSFWNIRSFFYYTQQSGRRFIEPKCHCKFQAMKVVNITQWGIPYVEAHLIALKDGQRFYGAYDW
jgi:glycosyltransferase involved in cell wall biosynthesis